MIIRDRRNKCRRARISKETIVGIVIVCALIGIVGSIFAYRQGRVFQLKIAFEDGHGLKVGDSVFVRGTDIGEVANTGFENNQFIATVAIQPALADQVRSDSAFFVAPDKIFLGKQCIQILVIDQSSAPLASGTLVKGEDSAVKYYGMLLRKTATGEASRLTTEMRSFIDGKPSSEPAASESSRN